MMTWYSPGFLTFPKVWLHQRQGRGKTCKRICIKWRQSNPWPSAWKISVAGVLFSHQFMSDPLITLRTSYTYTKLLVGNLCWKVCNTISPTLHKSRHLTQPCYESSYCHIMWSCHGSYPMLSSEHISSCHTVYSDK